MYFAEEKSQFVKCNMLLRLKQLCLCVICFAAFVILAVSYAIAHYAQGVLVSTFIAIVMFVCVIVSIVKTKQNSEQAWKRVLGDATSFKTLVELTDDESISFKREGVELPIIHKLADITNVDKFGSTIVIMFKDNTSMTLSKDNETDDLEKLLAIEQINSQRLASQKSFVGKTSLQICICTLFLATFVSMALSGAFTFGTAAWIQYSYIMYFFAIIPLCVLVVSIIFKSKKGRTSALVLIACLALWGSFRFYFNDITYDTALIGDLEQRINYQLPNAERLITEGSFYYTASVGKFSKEDADVFERKIEESDIWMGEPKFNKRNQFGKVMDDKLSKYDYFLVYDEVEQRHYGSQDTINWENCILMAYRVDTRSFAILYDFKRV